MSRFTFNSSIGLDMKAASADSFIDNMKMIDFSEIKLNKDNFYTLSELELLADDIERQGLKHNLVVSKDSAGSGYWLISGHRRYCAVKLLIEQNRLTNTLIPCYVDGERTQAEARLNLIMLNATQRKYTDAETMAEYEMLKQTIQQLEDEGKPVKGRIRDLIATTLNISPAQVGKIENIKHNAIDEVHEAVKDGKMSISTTNEVAKLTPEKQQEIITRKPTSEITHKEVKEIQKQTAPKPQKSTNEIPDEPDDESDTDEPRPVFHLEYIRPDDTEAAPSPAPSVPVLEKKPEFTSEKKNESKSASPDLKKITDTLELTAVEIAALHQYIDDLYNNLDCDDENEDTILGISIKIDCFLTKHGIET